MRNVELGRVQGARVSRVGSSRHTCARTVDQTRPQNILVPATEPRAHLCLLRHYPLPRAIPLELDSLPPDPSFHLFIIRFTYIYSHPQLFDLHQPHHSQPPTSLHPTLYRMCTLSLPYVFHGLCSSSLFHSCDTSQASGDMSALANMCRVGSLCMCRNEWMR